MADNKMRNTKNNRKEDGNFRSKKIKHDPNAESARAVNSRDAAGPVAQNMLSDTEISDEAKVIFGESDYKVGNKDNKKF